MRWNVAFRAPESDLQRGNRLRINRSFGVAVTVEDGALGRGAESERGRGSFDTWVCEGKVEVEVGLLK